MSFLHISLLAGLGLAALPVLVHLMSRKQPRRLTFPAIRFVRETVVMAERGWKVKHWLLLCLRGLLIGLLALALAGPRIHSAMLATYVSIGLLLVLSVLATAALLVAYATHRPRGVQITALIASIALWCTSLGWLGLALLRGEAPPSQASTGPIAAAIVVDTSPVMDYRFANKTRLEHAKEMGGWLIDRLPIESQIAIVANEQGLRLSQDRGAAERQLDRLSLEGKTASLARRVRAAVELVRSSSLERREVYVLTDMNAGAWRDTSGAELPELLSQDPSVLVQIIDCSVEPQTNWALSTPQLSQQVVGPDGMVDLQAEVSASDKAGDQQVTVELLREDVDLNLPIQRNGQTVVPASQLVDRQILDVPQGSTRTCRFRLRDLALGTYHFTLRLAQPDPLPIDNQLFVTVEAKPQGMTLIYAKEEAMAEQIQGILDPEGFSEGKAINSRVVPGSDLASLPLGQFAAIVLHDPPSLTSQAVERIQEFVVGGGGVLLILGSHFENEKALNEAPLAKLLPGPVARITRRPYQESSLVFLPIQNSHPVFYPFEKTHEEGIWNAYSIYRHWDLDTLTDKAATLIRYSGNDKPALVEEGRGQGKILTLTTPIPELAAPVGRRPWNDLWGTNAWPSYALFIGSMQYLSGWGKQRLNYEIGQAVSLDNNIDNDPERYELFSPDNSVQRVEPMQGSLLFPSAKLPGTYRLRGAKNNQPVVRGFSINLAKEDTRLQRIEKASLDEIVGNDRFLIARQHDEITSSVGQARFGRDLSPFLLLLLGLVMLAEQAMSSRFYSLDLSPASAKRKGVV